MLHVPAAPPFKVHHAPLVQALVQVNYPLVARLTTLEGAAPLQDALGDVLPYMNQQQVQELALTMGPAGPMQPQTSNTSVLDFSDDNGWTLNVSPGSATLSVGDAYAGVDDFAQRFERICSALAASAPIRRCDRIGVRYLDVVDVDASDQDWTSWFQPELVGVSDPNLTRGRLLASITETRLQTPPTGDLRWAVNGVNCVMRHGVVPAGSVIAGVPPRPVESASFVLDIDVWHAGPQPFGGVDLAAQFRSLHAEIERVFYWSLTDAGAEHFGLELEGGG